MDYLKSIQLWSIINYEKNSLQTRKKNLGPRGVKIPSCVTMQTIK